MAKLLVVSNIFKAEELHLLLKEDLQNINNIGFVLEKEPEGTMPLDPTVLVAIIGGSSTLLGSALGALITGLFGIWQKKKESSTQKSTAIVRIKVTKDSMELDFPYGMPADEQNALIQKAVELMPIKHIALIEKKIEK